VKNGVGIAHCYTVRYKKVHQMTAGIGQVVLVHMAAYSVRKKMVKPV
jgi:hypothetical protein